MDVSLNGFYKIGEDVSGSLVSVIMFNPDTCETERFVVEDYEYQYLDGPFFAKTLSVMTEEEMYQLRCAPIDEWARREWCKYENHVEEGCVVEVFKGRKVPIGTVGEVVAIEAIYDNYGRQVGTRAVLADGQKTSVDNLNVIG